MAQEVYTDYENKKESEYEYMHDWVFHFNPYTSLWNAIPRNLYNDYWSNYDIKGILRSKNINTLLELLQKFKGNAQLIEQLINSDTKK